MILGISSVRSWTVKLLKPPVCVLSMPDGSIAVSMPYAESTGSATVREHCP